jgi:hypothetical protein
MLCHAQPTCVVPLELHECAGRFLLDLYRPDDLMRLDMAAQRALHIFPARGESLNNNTTSVYGILNHTRTAMGKRLLRSWLKQPLRDVRAITERHAVVAAFVDDAEMRYARLCSLLRVHAPGCRASHLTLPFVVFSRLAQDQHGRVTC